jgi:hypothetical protein
MVPILSQINPVHTIPSYLSKINMIAMKGKSQNVGFEVLKAVAVKRFIFWDIMLCSPLSCFKLVSCVA